MFIGRTDVEAETPILWPPLAKSQTGLKRLSTHALKLLIGSHTHGFQKLGGLFFGRNDAKAETPVLWLPHVKS